MFYVVVQIHREAAIGPNVQSLKPLLMVLDTYADNSILYADLQAPEPLTCQSIHRLDTLGIEMLKVKIASFAFRQPFVAVRRPAGHGHFD